MKLLITMAGVNNRFLSISSGVPKYLLPFGSSVILNEVMNNYDKADVFDEISLICNNRDLRFRKIIEYHLNSWNFPKSQLHFVNNTSSQVETAELGITKSNWQDDKSPIIITNIDTIIRNRDFVYTKQILQKYDGYIDGFVANSPEYSYAIFDSDFNLNVIKSKIVISDTACSGLYGFKSPQFLMQQIQENNDLLVSDFSNVYEKMLERKRKILVKRHESFDDTIVLGTPEEYFVAI